MTGPGSATLQAAGLRALGAALFVALFVWTLGSVQAADNKEACSGEHVNEKPRKACKRQANEQRADAIWTALAAGGAVALVRFCGEGLYDRRRQNRGLGPKLGDVQW